MEPQILRANSGLDCLRYHSDSLHNIGPIILQIVKKLLVVWAPLTIALKFHKRTAPHEHDAPLPFPKHRLGLLRLRNLLGFVTLRIASHRFAIQLISEVRIPGDRTEYLVKNQFLISSRQSLHRIPHWVQRVCRKLVRRTCHQVEVPVNRVSKRLMSLATSLCCQ